MISGKVSACLSTLSNDNSQKRASNLSNNVSLKLLTVAQKKLNKISGHNKLH